MSDPLPLPEPDGVIVVGTQAMRAFTAEQMHAYAAAAVAAERERIAAMLDMDWPADGAEEREHRGYCAAAIRAQ
jgi:hypothetical protein